MNEDELITLLKKELRFLNDAANILKRSYEICQNIGIKDVYPT